MKKLLIVMLLITPTFVQAAPVDDLRAKEDISMDFLGEEVLKCQGRIAFMQNQLAIHTAMNQMLGTDNTKTKKVLEQLRKDFDRTEKEFMTPIRANQRKQGINVNVMAAKEIMSYKSHLYGTRAVFRELRSGNEKTSFYVGAMGFISYCMKYIPAMLDMYAKENDTKVVPPSVPSGR